MYLRLSVTDACDFRCWYCRPKTEGGSTPATGGHLESDDLLALVDAINAATPLAKVRITGGEPLLRHDLLAIVSGIRKLRPDVTLSITTNGHHLGEHAASLHKAGLDRINISFDSLDSAVFRRITGVDGLERVRYGVKAAQRAGFEKMKLNAVLLRSGAGAELGKLVGFAAREGLEIRFIELMPSGLEAKRYREEFMPSSEALRALRTEGGYRGQLPSSGTALRYLFEWEGREVTVGFIPTVSEPFCDACDRLRLDARGLLRGCLRRDEATDLGVHLPRGRDAVAAVVREVVEGKRGPEDGWNTTPMIQIGG